MLPFRFLRRSPALAAAAIASLALGIGAAVTVYSVVREMVLDDLSASQPDRLARVDAQVSYSQYRQLRAAGVLQDLAFQLGFGDIDWRSSAGGERVWRLSASANFFDVLGVRASAGRLFTQAGEGSDVAVVSYGFWQRRLHSDPHAVGRSLELNGRLYTVLGILPRDYRSVMGHGVSPEVYLPAGSDSAHCRLFGRLRPDLTRDQTREALEAAAQRIGGAEFARQVATLRPMAGLAANSAGEGDQRRFFLFFVMLFAVAGMLALIACSNVAGLMLARSASRRKELAIRKALGAGRLQLARPMLAEGLVLVLCGAAAGLALDAFLRSRLSALRWPSAYDIPIEFHFQSDRGLLLYALLVSAIALPITSAIPALRSSRADLGLALKQGEPAFSLRRWNPRNGFVLLQVALSMVLLSLGALFTRSFVQLARSGPGFDAAHTIIAAVHGATDRDALVRRLEAVPGVLGVTSIGTLPFMGELPFERVRREGAPPETYRDVYAMGAGEHYFATLGIPILRGRDFEIRDRDRTPTPAIVSRTLAELLFGDGDPVGARLLAGRGHEQAVEIVGVAADTRLRTLGEDRVAAIYTPFFAAQFLVRVAGLPARQLEPLRAALAQAEPGDTLDIHPMSDAVEGALFPMRMASALVGSLSLLGMLLALVGLYGSISYSVGRRTREMGIRSALGATARRITWTALGDGIAILAIGGALGMALAIAAIRPLADLLPDGIDPWDPPMLAAPALLLAIAGALAAWLPAHRAAAVDPSLALRQD
ncbi:MAG: ABC transporter permease [Candidatus Sulfopaludibacter sp.]|nr:ABC transporter permease [Candidatus Sulfopaludibacter sp.]